MYCFISAVPAAFYWACWHTSIPKLDRITYIFLLVLEEYVHLLLLQCLQTLLQITQERAHLIWSLCHAHVQNKRRVCRKVQQISFLQETNTFIIIIITTVVLLLLLLLLHDLYSTNYEDRVRGAGVTRWRTWLTGEGEKVRF